MRDVFYVTNCNAIGVKSIKKISVKFIHFKDHRSQAKVLPEAAVGFTSRRGVPLLDGRRQVGRTVQTRICRRVVDRDLGFTGIVLQEEEISLNK
jgi:hypothetical protein